ncbi:MAG: hypothetical protein U5L03_09315 [Burkholderiaceae bacterium]|nr:hypothetical protein [Burkholderiaceae bacterium]
MIRDTADGRVLVHCFAGCQTADVLAALGLDWSAICPPRDKNVRRTLRRERVTTASDALRCLSHEATIVAIAAGDLAQGKPLSEHDRNRLLLAAGRINSARSLCDA